MQIVTRQDKQTRELGQRLGERLRAGDVVLLFGDMGAGKSELARGIAKGLDVDGPVPSPTFTIMQMYTDGRVPLYHFDWYRLSGPEELYEMGMEEYLGGDGVALVEWPTRAMEAVPQAYLSVTISRLDEADGRVFEIKPVGGFRALEGRDAFERFDD